MPKILIKEKNLTSSGTAPNYANYSVLIAGFSLYSEAERCPSTQDDIKTLKGEGRLLPDENGIYEFTSQTDFEKTIGLVKPEITNGTDDTVIACQYGNQMAYELLGQGYTVIYKVIDSIGELAMGGFWDIFKDKASYDFRFITHGLLKSFPSAVGTKTECEDRLAAVKAAKIQLDLINSTIEENPSYSSDTDKANAKDDLYKKLTEDLVSSTGLEDPSAGLFKTAEVDPESGLSYVYKIGTSCFDVTDSYYTTFADAVEKVEIERVALENELARISLRSMTSSEFNEANKLIAEIASFVTKTAEEGKDTGRGDCVALLELDETTYLDTGSIDRPEILMKNGLTSTLQSITNNHGAYCAVTVPSVVYKTAFNDAFKGNKKFPGAFHYLSCFMSSLRQDFAEWYAAAGYTRGTCGYAVDHTTVKLGEIAINVLEPRSAGGVPFACNVIANFRGSYYLWGNRTAAALKDDLTAEHFLNIRHLCTTLKKQLYVACRRFTFDPNSDTLWINFVNAIRPTLDKMRAEQGIRDYKIVREYTDKKATLKARIRIVPIEAVEDFDLTVSLEDSFGEAAVSFGE